MARIAAVALVAYGAVIIAVPAALPTTMTPMTGETTGTESPPAMPMEEKPGMPMQERPGM
jgi:hypothetical protein